jgi:transcriptional regulator with XRE-family HTH domain/lambda repressor-like predicted transcriptional regulator
MQEKRDKNIYTQAAWSAYVVSEYGRSAAMSRESAGAAIRELRESRNWSLADFASVTGVSIMGLSYLERGARKAHKGTVQKVENGLGLPPGTYSRLVVAADSTAELERLTSAPPAELTPLRTTGPVVVDRHTDTEMLEGYAEAQLDALKSVIGRLPAETSNEYETYILSVIEQCVKAEMLAANSWRVAVNADVDSAGRLMQHLEELEAIRGGLLERLPTSLSARLDRACARSPLPEAVIAALLGVTAAEMWDIRNRGVIPPGAQPRVRAFADLADVADGDQQ